MIAAVLAGAGAAQAGLLPAPLVDCSELITQWALCLLLLLVGFDLGRNRSALRRLLGADRSAFLVPAGVILGTLLGGLAVTPFLELGWADSLAVASGFGWYSLSAVIIADVKSADLGSVAFLANVFRELLSILLIPLIARYVGPYVSVAPGGATTMDTTLPIIEKYAGEGPAVVGFVNGFVLSALVPVLVPFFLRF